MEEATEIAKLRLFLALVASAQSLEELEPLPNIDFNVMAGNSLIGLIQVDGERFDAVKETTKQKKRKAQQASWAQESAQTDLFQETYVQGTLLQPDTVITYRQILEEKNASIDSYKKKAFASEKDGETPTEQQLLMLRSSIDELNQRSQEKLNQLLFREFSVTLGIKYEDTVLEVKPPRSQNWGQRDSQISEHHKPSAGVSAWQLQSLAS